MIESSGGGGILERTRTMRNSFMSNVVTPLAADSALFPALYTIFSESLFVSRGPRRCDGKEAAPSFSIYSYSGIISTLIDCRLCHPLVAHECPYA